MDSENVKAENLAEEIEELKVSNGNENENEEGADNAQVDGDEGTAEVSKKKKKKKKKKNKSSKKKDPLKQTDPPSIPVIELFPSGEFPEGEIQR